MIPLRVKGKALNIADPVIGKVSVYPDLSETVVLVKRDTKVSIDVSDKLLVFEGKPYHIEGYKNSLVYNCLSVNHLQSGDIIVANSKGLVETLYRKESHHNALFITDRCNSNCLMCSQPPKDIDDLDYLYRINMRLIPLIPKTTELLGITGGEPTLLGKRLTTLVESVTEHLPDTEIHMLTNGRAFAWRSFSDRFSEIEHSKLVLGIPLYSDFYAEHDYIVQAQNAFSQTVLGMYNLARLGVRIEIRVVLHKQSVNRLIKLAEFIYRNLPFAEHVAFMGLEYTGYTPHNDNLLWIEPNEYVEPLYKAVNYLDSMGMHVSIYNLQLCLLPEALWGFCRKSISSWKQDYLEICNSCTKLDECGGVFATSKKLSERLQAIH